MMCPTCGGTGSVPGPSPVLNKLSLDEIKERFPELGNEVVKEFPLPLNLDSVVSELRVMGRDFSNWAFGAYESKAPVPGKSPVANRQLVVRSPGGAQRYDLDMVSSDSAALKRALQNQG